VTPPRTIIGSVLNTPLLRSPLKRRIIFGLLIVALAVLCLYPRTYVAEAQLMPQTPGGGLSTALAQESNGAILDLGALTGSKTSVESDLTVARSHAVTQDVVNKLKHAGRHGWSTRTQAEAALDHKIGIIAIRGSILQITAHDTNPEFARSLVAVTADAIQDRLGEISIRQSAQKRAVATNRLLDAQQRLAVAQQALTDWRSKHRLAEPQAQLSAGIGQLASLQSELKAKQVELGGLRRFATEQNLQVKTVEAQIGSLEGQIASAQANGAPGAGNLSLNELSAANVEYSDLVRDETVAETLYKVYTRYMDELTIDEMSARENMNLIEPAYIEPGRQLNVWAVGLLLLTILLAVGAEFYMVGQSTNVTR
jgi:uncharacterized protein involved in exopolysaccharide biosynthesis